MATTPIYEFEDLDYKVERIKVKDTKGQLSAGEYNALLQKVRDNDQKIKDIIEGSITDDKIAQLKSELKAYIDSNSGRFVYDDDDDPTTNSEDDSESLNIGNSGYQAEASGGEYPDFSEIS